MTKRLYVGKVAVGGGAAVSIQSMCNTKTDDVPATVAQIRALETAGCEIIRVAVPDTAAAEAVDKIKEQISIPLIVDIHFNYKLALMCAERGADAIRINPGNIGGEERVKAVADACRARGIPIRVGVNGGSLEKELLAKYGAVTPEAKLNVGYCTAPTIVSFKIGVSAVFTACAVTGTSSASCSTASRQAMAFFIISISSSFKDKTIIPCA